MKKAHYKIHKATLDDATGIHALIHQYANKRGDFLLPRPLANIYENIRDFFVCHSSSGKVIGCVALRVLWEGLGEIRSLAVSRKYQGHGIGFRLLEAAIDEAIMMKMTRVFALTMKPDFFLKHDFKIIDKNELPHKIWGECINCHLFPNCSEVPVLLEF